MENNNNTTKPIFRAVYKSELKSYLKPEELKKDNYSLENCINSYAGKNNIDYSSIANKHCPASEQAYFLHFFDDFKHAQKYAKALHDDSFTKSDTTIIACQFPNSVLSSCEGFGIYENSSQSDQSKVFKEYAIPLNLYTPKQNLVGEATSETETTPIEPPKQDDIPQVFYDPDDYSSFF